MAKKTEGSFFEVIAHRGAHTNWHKGGYSARDGCEALHMKPPLSQFVENTLPAVQQAFEFGATMVEIDIRLTRDGKLAVIHDGELRCKTDGKGLVRDWGMLDLKKLDAGYRFSVDGGKTYPFRGKAKGMISELGELLDALPQKRLLIDHKDADEASLKALEKTVAGRSMEDQKRLFYWGPLPLFQKLQQQIPEIRRFFPGKNEIKRCLMPYMASGGRNGIATACKGMVMGMNLPYSRFVPGWPHRFMKAMKKNGNSLFLMVDTEQEARAFGKVKAAGIVTDDIKTIGPLYRDRLTSFQPPGN